MKGPGLLLAASLFATPAVAQVTVNPGALDLLPSQPQPQRQAPRPAPRPPARPATPAQPQPTAPQAAAPAPAPPARPAVPTVPPAVAALPPPAPVPPPRTAAPPVVPVAADAPGAATPVLGGIRVTFGADRQDLNPATEAALRDLARSLRANDRVSINIYAYASGSADDPSTARRLSLGRALAARAVLITEGIASTRIYPRALGVAGGDMDRDRVDVVAGTPGPPDAATASPAPMAPAR